jgi:hypothetical protein
MIYLRLNKQRATAWPEACRIARRNRERQGSLGFPWRADETRFPERHRFRKCPQRSNGCRWKSTLR